jgi:tetratricopeptide (TPR) repeat protein
MCERFVFISSIGFCIFIGWLIFKSLEVQKFKSLKVLAVFVLIIILGLYSVKTISRNKAWEDDFTLFTTDIKTSKNSAKGNSAVAGIWLSKATISANKNDIQSKKNYCEKSLLYFNRALELYPIFETDNQFFEIYQLCAGCLSINPNEIIQQCDELLKKGSNLGKIYYLKGRIYGQYLNEIELSLINLEKADSYDFAKGPDFYNNLGIVYGISGNFEKSISNLLKAIELDPNDPGKYKNLEQSYRKLGDINNANFYAAKGNELKATNN